MSSNAIVNQGNIQRLLQEGVNAVAQFEYERYEPEYKAFLSVEDSEKAYEIDVSMAGLTSAQEKPEGQEIVTDGEQQLYTTVYQNTVYALGTVITFEAMANNLYYNMIQKSGRMLENSLQQTENIVGADVINEGYNAAVQLGDGQPLFSEDHVLKSGTASNRFAAPTALSEAALEDACIAVSRHVDNAGLRFNAKVRGVCVPPELTFDIHRILGSNFQPGTANNAVNSIVNMGKFPEGYSVNHYFTDTSKWFITTDVPDAGKFFSRMGHTFRSDNSDTNTLNYRHIGMTYFSTGVTDWRGFYGSGA